MNPFKWFESRLRVIFEYGLIVGQFWLAFSQTAWAQAYASTALASAVQALSCGNTAKGVLDMMGVAAVIGAVFLGPQALLFGAVKFYLDARAKVPIVVKERREEPRAG